MPALGLDRLWLRNDGHLVLLDFLPPSPVHWTHRLRRGRLRPPALPIRDVTGFGARGGGLCADLTPVGLLSAVATHGLSVTAHTPEQPAPLPLSARALLDGLVQRHASGARRRANGAHRRRVGSGPCGAVAPSGADRAGVRPHPGPADVGAPAAAIPLQVRELRECRDVWLAGSAPPAGSAGQQSAGGARRSRRCRAIRRWPLRCRAQRQRSLEHDRSCSEGTSPSCGGRRRQIMARHPSVSAEELARVSATIAPQIERSEQYYKLQASRVAGAGAIVISTLTALSMTLVAGLRRAVVGAGAGRRRDAPAGPRRRDA